MLYNLSVTWAKTIGMATSVGLGLAVFGDLACRSADKIENTEPASVLPLTEIEPPAIVEPIGIKGVEPSGVGTRKIVIEDDVRKLCEVRDLSKLPAGKYRFENGHLKPILINGVDKPAPSIIRRETIDDASWRIRFGKRGAWTPPDIIHGRMWEDERKGFLLAPSPGK